LFIHKSTHKIHSNGLYNLAFGIYPFKEKQLRKASIFFTYIWLKDIGLKVVTKDLSFSMPSTAWGLIM